MTEPLFPDLDFKQLDFESICPFCGARHEHATTTLKGSSPPQDGDVTMCIECGEWAAFDAGATGGLRKPTAAEYEEISNDPLTRKMRAAWVKTSKKKGGSRGERGNR